MKKIFIINLFAMSTNICFASAFCPPSVTCAQANKISSCTINGDASIFNQVDTANNLQTGTHNFKWAYFFSDNSYCVYQNGNSYIQLKSKAMLTPDMNANNAWRGSDKSLMLCYYNITGVQDCPFTPVH